MHGTHTHSMHTYKHTHIQVEMWLAYYHTASYFYTQYLGTCCELNGFLHLCL